MIGQRFPNLPDGRLIQIPALAGLACFIPDMDMSDGCSASHAWAAASPISSGVTGRWGVSSRVTSAPTKAAVMINFSMVFIEMIAPKTHG